MQPDRIYNVAAETICHKITSLIGGVCRLLIYFIIFYLLISLTYQMYTREID